MLSYTTITPQLHHKSLAGKKSSSGAKGGGKAAGGKAVPAPAPGLSTGKASTSNRSLKKGDTGKQKHSVATAPKEQEVAPQPVAKIPKIPVNMHI